MKKLLLLSLTFAFAAMLSHAQTNLYVNASAIGTNSGASWTDAFTSLEAALNVANSGSSAYNIYVAAGTYKPSNQHGGTARDAFFGISRGGIKIYGGYDANSGSRNLTANPTILSGDIGLAEDKMDNSYHVMVIAGLTSSADSVVVDGLTISKGFADGLNLLTFNGKEVAQYTGAGVSVFENGTYSKLLFRNTTFTDNDASYGGGVVLDYAYGSFDKCTFSNNNSGQSGAGIATLSDGNLKITQSEFKNNTGYSGAAIFVEYNSNATISSSVLENNQTSFSGGAIQCNGGVFVVENTTFTGNGAQQMAGAIFTMQLQNGSRISNTKFLQNTSAFGGALSFSGTTAAKVENSVFEGNTATGNGGAVTSSFDNGLIFSNTFFVNNSSSAGMGGAYSSSNWQGGSFINCVFSGNSAGQGGAVALTNASGGGFNLCTFSNNSASADGQAIYLPSGISSFSNSIVWKDANYTGTDNINTPSSGATLTLENNLIQQATIGGAVLAPTNINTNPMFVDAANVKGADGIYGTTDDGLQLMAGSPALNVGSNSLVPVGTTTDIAGSQRIRQTTVDMGAYEANFAPPVITAQPANISTCENGTATFSVTASAAVNYQWQVFDGTSYTNLSNGGSYSGATTATLTITNATAGLSGMKYLCNVNNGFGTTPSEMGTLTVTSINVNLTTTNVACNGAANGTAVVVASGGTAPYTYSWKSLANSEVIGTTAEVDSLAVGNYQVTVTDNSSCSKTVDFTITEPTVISISIAKTDVTTCNTDASGAATATVTGGTAPYTYSWKSAESMLEVSTTATMSNVLGGKYMLTVTDAKGCTKLDSVEIARPAAFVVVAEQTNVTDFTSPDGMAKVTVSGASAPYTYLWTKGATTLGTTNAISNLVGGKYTCTITDANGCTFVQHFTLTTPILRTVYVNQAAASGGDGTSWASAFQTLKDALAFSNQNLTIDEIRIAQGTYYPTGAQTNTGRDQMFLITRGGIKLFGGYDAATGQRDVANNTTILSGNIGDVNTASDNSMKVMVFLGIPKGADSIKVDGLTIQDAAGRRNWPSDYVLRNNLYIYTTEGSALYLLYCSNNVTFSNCVFKNNEIEISGGGTIAAIASKLKLDNCIIENNKARQRSVFYGVTATLELINCKIRNNNSEYGGIDLHDVKATIKNTIFENNSAQSGVSAILALNSDLVVEDSKFENNVALGAATVFLRSGSASFKKTSFISNSAKEGAAIFCQSFSGTLLDIDQCVFSNNSTRNGAAAIDALGVQLKVNNSLFIGNRSNTNANAAVLTVSNSNIKNVTFYDNGKIGDARVLNAATGTNNLSNTIFWNNKASSDVNSSLFSTSYSVVRGQSATSTNIDTDPLFVDASNPIGTDGIWGTADDGLRLQNCSPSANTGWNEGIANDAKDLLGNARIQDGRADMGAYERVAAAQAQLITSGSTESSNFQSSNSETSYVDNCGKTIAIVSGDNTPTSVIGPVLVKTIVPNNSDLTHVGRYIQITPTINASLSSGIVTLIYKQSDFDIYNGKHPNRPQLPTGPNDTQGISNMVIDKYPGTSSDGSLNQASFTGSATELRPLSVEYTGAMILTKVTVDGFSGFFLRAEAPPTVLPLSLISFTGKAINNGNQLVWKTAKESNLTHYVLERSSNGKEYGEISTIKPKNGEAQSYSYLDKALVNGTLYYRLKITENDGKVSYSNVVALKGLSSNTNYLAPNPAVNVVQINISDSSLINTEASIVNTGGQIVKKLRITANSQGVDIADLAKGMYILRLANGESLKLIKQ